MAPPRPLLTLCAGIALVALAACGGDDPDNAADSTTTSSSTSAGGGGCTPVEEVDVELGGQHSGEEFSAQDYPTNPPAGGDHNPTPIQAGTFYPDPPRLGEAVHLLEHGAVIGWTNELSKADRQAVEEEFNDIFQDGYYQLAVVENPELEVPFALSAWGALQTCEQVDTSVIRPFVEQWYASSKSAEGGLACEGEARRLTNC